MAATQEIVKRIPRIKFPVRRSSAPPAPGVLQAKQSAETDTSTPQHTSDVPASPRHQGSGGSASVQPRRTPVTDKEIEAIVLGGVF